MDENRGRFYFSKEKENRGRFYFSKVKNRTVPYFSYFSEVTFYPKQGFLPLLAVLERQLSLPLRLRFPIIIL